MAAFHRQFDQTYLQQLIDLLIVKQEQEICRSNKTHEQQVLDRWNKNHYFCLNAD